MPPAPVKIERIAGDRTRQNTFHKRKLGLIKKAIELTVLCDCDIAIILKSGPTIMCPEGKMSAYCNKDLNEMITQYMADPPQETYSNAEYARLSKGDCNLDQQNAQPSQTAPAMSMPAIEVDLETGTHGHLEQQEQALKQRVASMQDELEKLRNVVAPVMNAGQIATAVHAAISETEPDRKAGRKRSLPPLACEEISSGPLPFSFLMNEEPDNKRQCKEEGAALAQSLPSPVINMTSPHVNMASPLVNMASPHVNMTSPLVNVSGTPNVAGAPPPFLVQAGVGREISWDLSNFYTAPTPLETEPSPFHLLNTPMAATTFQLPGISQG